MTSQARSKRMNPVTFSATNCMSMRDERETPVMTNQTFGTIKCRHLVCPFI